RLTDGGQTTEEAEIAGYVGGRAARSGFPAHHGALAISEDGRTIVFETRDVFDPVNDGDTRQDVYIWRDGVVTLISARQGSDPDCTDAASSRCDAEFVGM